ncbi:MAG: ComEC/Rec2 family competence protein [Eisenbergiella sp.]
MVQRYGSALESTVLDAGHHGSGNATKDSFLDAVKPKAVLISCGKDNSYGHPAKEMIARVEKRRIPWYVTARDGALTVRVSGNGERFFIVPFTERRQAKEP